MCPRGCSGDKSFDWSTPHALLESSQDTDGLCSNPSFPPRPSHP
uniref:Uncharacterized protein n=1 Tax=Anguilla anguilla TaxID=7936 RepID=A0A0E9SKK9_ANGAN